MTIRGIAKGRIIELEETLPFQDGEALDVSVHAAGADMPKGSGAAILKALRESPPVDPETMDEFERILRESKQPGSNVGAFDDLRNE